ncbi:MAG: lipocalin family protein [Rhodanobacter sp.]
MRLSNTRLFKARLSKARLLAYGLVLASVNSYAGNLPPIQPVPHVDLPRFMGQWYLIATIPTRFEKSAYNAIETYTLQPDGCVYTSLRFRNGSFGAPVKTIHSLGFVKPDSGNSVWGIQLFWPLKAQYIVAYLSADYSEMIVARDARDYTWVMARTPTIPQSDYDGLMARVKQLGYSMADIRKVPQAWPEAGQ